jgi:activator of HSP90 ATPase
MTGGEATGRPVKGTRFTAWDGYISSKNLELEPHRRIVQAWRTTEFSSGDADSRLEVLLEEAPGGIKVTLRHCNIPQGQTGYKQGWKDHYFEPMKRYFSA